MSNCEKWNSVEDLLICWNLTTLYRGLRKKSAGMQTKWGEGIIRVIEMKCWCDGIRLQQRWAVHRQKVRVCCETRGANRSAVLLADVLFPAVQQCIVSLPHTHSFPRPCLLFSVPSFSPTLSQINLSALSSHPLPNIHRCNQMKYTIFFLSLPTWETCQTVCALMLIFAFMMRSTVSQAPQVTGEPFQITHITNKLDWCPSEFHL